MRSGRCTLLLCDEDRAHTEPLAFRLVELGHTVTVARTYADAFAAACAYDYDVLVAAPFLRDRPALGLPDALGIRRPRLALLMTRMSERLAKGVAKRVGFDGQLAKVVDARDLDRLVRAHARAVHESESDRAVEQNREPPDASRAEDFRA